MKSIILAYQRIITQIRKSPMIFAFFFIGSLMASLVFIYFFGNGLYSKVNASNNTLENRTYLVFFSAEQKITQENLAVLDDYGAIEVKLAGPATLDEENQKKVQERVELSLIAYRENQKNMEEKAIEEFVIQDEYLQTYAVILPKYLGEGLSEIEVNGVPLQIVDCLDHFMVQLIVPINIFTENFGATEITFTLPSAQTAEEIESIHAMLIEGFPDAAEIITPAYFNDMEMSQDAKGLTYTGLLYVCSLLSFLFLFKYIVDQSQLENVVYHMVGAKRTTIMKIVILEIVILTAVSSLCGILLHVLFYDAFFARINFSEGIRYDVKDYLFILISTILLSLISSLPFFIQLMRSTTATLKERFKG